MFSCLDYVLLRLHCLLVLLHCMKTSLDCSVSNPREDLSGGKRGKNPLNLFEWTSYKYVCCLLQIVTETSIRVAIEMLLLSKHRYSSNYTELLACWYGTLFFLNSLLWC